MSYENLRERADQASKSETIKLMKEARAFVESNFGGGAVDDAILISAYVNARVAILNTECTTDYLHDIVNAVKDVASR